MLKLISFCFCVKLVQSYNFIRI